MYFELVCLGMNSMWGSEDEFRRNSNFISVMAVDPQTDAKQCNLYQLFTHAFWRLYWTIWPKRGINGLLGMYRTTYHASQEGCHAVYLEWIVEKHLLSLSACRTTTMTDPEVDCQASSNCRWRRWPVFWAGIIHHLVTKERTNSVFLLWYWNSECDITTSLVFISICCDLDIGWQWFPKMCMKQNVTRLRLNTSLEVLIMVKL